MIRLWFGELLDDELEAKLPGRGSMIRLFCRASFKKKDGEWTDPYLALIDSGAPISLIPKKIWSNSDINDLTDHSVGGIVQREDCRIDVKVGEVTTALWDRENRSKEYGILSYFAPNDEVPLILGFKDLLSRFKLCFDYEADNAFIEEK